MKGSEICGRVSHFADVTKACEILLGESDHSRDVGVNKRMILKWIAENKL
jgi:hypothetical protein